jgi:uncharacterized membrane protein (UPF0127 family)
MVMKNSNKILIALVIFAVFFFGLFYSQNFAIVSGEAIKLERAETAEAKQKGLSGRKSLCGGCGMLFSYDKPQEIGIWMKDMKFSIDIVWLDKEKRITHVESSVTPETYPTTFSDRTARSQFVVELPSKYIQEHQIKNGDKLYFW